MWAEAAIVEAHRRFVPVVVAYSGLARLAFVAFVQAGTRSSLDS